MSTRLRLRRDDGEIFLERWGWECKRFGIFIHKMEAPDPGVDLHNHPWPFASFVISGGYEEQRALDWEAQVLAAVRLDQRGDIKQRKRWSFKKFPLNEAHRIVKVKPHTWTIVFRGRAVRPWGFFTPDGYMDARTYEHSEFGKARQLSEVFV